MRILLTFSFLFLFSISALAQLDGNPENWCRNGLFPRESENYRLGDIKGKKGERIYFYGDENNCPKGKNCRLKSYVIPNDEVIVSRTFGNFSCVWYQPKKGRETVGWIQTNKISFADIAQPVDQYVGKWSFYDNEIEISKTDKNDIFKVTGNAIWKGLGDNVHIGELDGDAKFISNKLEYEFDETDEYACKVTLRLIGKYLIVSDNLNCGGANVTFSGIYQKNVKR